MAKLSDSQLVVLSSAALRDDGLAVVPAKMTKAAAAKVGASLVARKLMREIRAKPGAPAWRSDADGRSFSLAITRAGRDAIGVEDESVSEVLEQPAVVPRKAPKPRPAEKSASKGDAGLKSLTPVAPFASTSSPRAGSKQATIIAMLSGKGGATLDALIEATGWLPHTTRAALTGLRKRGFVIERARQGDASVYRIVKARDAAAAA